MERATQTGRAKRASSAPSKNLFDRRELAACRFYYTSEEII